MSESVPPISDVAEMLAWRAHDARELGRVAAKELAAAKSNDEDPAVIEELQTDYANLVEEFNQSSAMAACIFGPEWGRYRELTLGPNHQPDYEVYGGAYGVSDRLAIQLNMPMTELVDIYGRGQGEVNPLLLAQIQHGLAREGLHTLGDVLVLGTRPGNAGSLPGFAAMERTVNRIDPAFDWSQSPSMALTAKICRTPSEVSARVLGKVCDKLRVGGLTQSRSLQDFLDVSDEELVPLIASFNPDASVDMIEKSVGALRRKTDAFARDFLTERRKLLRKLAQK